MAQQKQTGKNFKEQTSYDLNMKHTLKILSSKVFLDRKKNKYHFPDPAFPKAAILHTCT